MRWPRVFFFSRWKHCFLRSGLNPANANSLGSPCGVCTLECPAGARITLDTVWKEVSCLCRLAPVSSHTLCIVPYTSSIHTVQWASSPLCCAAHCLWIRHHTHACVLSPSPAAVDFPFCVVSLPDARLKLLLARLLSREFDHALRRSAVAARAGAASACVQPCERLAVCASQLHGAHTHTRVPQ